MDINENRRMAVKLLAEIVVESNLYNYLEFIEDNYAVPFSEYGTDIETIKQVVEELYPEVAEKVKELQSDEC